jgi:hypothetical protein
MYTTKYPHKTIIDIVKKFWKVVVEWPKCPNYLMFICESYSLPNYENENQIILLRWLFSNSNQYMTHDRKDKSWFRTTKNCILLPCIYAKLDTPINIRIVVLYYLLYKICWIIRPNPSHTPTTLLHDRLTLKMHEWKLRVNNLTKNAPPLWHIHIFHFFPLIFFSSFLELKPRPKCPKT